MYAMTPAIVGEQDLAAANAVSNSVEHIAILLGPAIGGVLLLLGVGYLWLLQVGSGLARTSTTASI